MPVKITLLASAPTLDGIREQITRFYGGERKVLDKAAGDDLWAVCRADGSHIRGRVIFRSRAADARAECREFIRNWREGGELARAEMRANLAEQVIW